MRLLEPYFRMPEATGLHIHGGSDGQLQISFCGVKLTGNRLSINRKVTGINSLKELSKHSTTGAGLALNLSGKGILIKKVTRMDEPDATSFARLLPNGNPADFYLQNFVSGEHSFIALIRRSDAHQWLEKLATLGFNVLSLSLGPFVAEQVLPQLNFYGDDVIFSEHHVTRNENKEWLHYQYESGALAPFPVKLEAEKLDEQLILPYAAAFQLILSGSLSAIHAPVIELDNKLQGAIKGRKVQVISFGALGVLFVLLLLNFLLFFHYNEANEELAERVGKSSRTITDVESLNSQIKFKEARLDSLGWEDGVKKSLLVDEIAQLLPPEVTWEEVSVDPQLQPGGGATKVISFENRKIIIKGQTQRIVLVNEWLNRLKSLKWVRNVQLKGYNYNNEQDTGQFTVIIDY